MLETNLTMYQLLGTLEQKEYLQRIINLLNSNKQVCENFDKFLNKSEEYCKNKEIQLPETYPHYQN